VESWKNIDISQSVSIFELPLFLACVLIRGNEFQVFFISGWGLLDVPRSNEEEWSVGFAHVTQQADNISDVILPPLLLRLFPFFFFSFFFLVLSWEICDLMAPLAKAMCSTLDFKFTGSFITTIALVFAGFTVSKKICTAREVS